MAATSAKDKPELGNEPGNDQLPPPSPVGDYATQKSGPAPAKARSTMTIKGGLTFDEEAIIERPEGSKFRLMYDRGDVTFRGKEGEFAGKIDAGEVNVLARRDGVLVFSHRLLIKFGTYPLAATFEGVVDLRPLIAEPVRGPDVDGPTTYSLFVRGTGAEIDELDLEFAARFEGTQGLSPVEDNSWARGAVATAASASANFVELLRNPFNARAKVTLRRAPFYPPSKVTIDVYEASSLPRKT